MREMDPSENTKKCTCIDGYFDTDTDICQSCHPTCKTCKGLTENDCLSCYGDP